MNSIYKKARYASKCELIRTMLIYLMDEIVFSKEDKVTLNAAYDVLRQKEGHYQEETDVLLNGVELNIHKD